MATTWMDLTLQMKLKGTPMHTASRVRTAAFFLTAFITLGAFAQKTSPPATPGSAVTLSPVAVSGVLPGPPLWKVSKDGHVMWILGITSPLPRGVQWESPRVEHLIASSQQVLKPPGLEIGAQIGLWGRLLLIPSMIGLKKLPDGKMLQQVLSPDLYSRWQVQKIRYLGHGSGVERLRPTFGGQKLYSAALLQSGLIDNHKVEAAIYYAADRAKVPVTDTSYVMVLDDPHRAAKQFKQVAMNDQQCLSGILSAIEQDFPQASELGHAWATGDMETLTKILSAKQQDDCLSAIGSTDFGKEIGMNDISARIRQAWIKAAEAALAQNSQSLAVLPMNRILTGDGYLKELQKDGYTVQSPDALIGANPDN
jgi:hypothetical protein